MSPDDFGTSLLFVGPAGAGHDDGETVETLKQARMHAEEAARLREVFIGILGHDLRAPLGAIAMSARGLLLQKVSDPKRAVERIAKSAERMDRLIRDVLDVVRTGFSGGLRVQPASMSVEEICTATIEEVMLAHPERRVVLETEGETTVQADADRIAQVMTNLLSNALQYSPPDTRVRIKIVGRENVDVFVQNEGPAIPAELLPRLFEPFRRAGEAARVTQGLGLGLFIVREILRAHGASIGVDSSPTGTTFRFQLSREGPAAMTHEPGPHRFDFAIGALPLSESTRLSALYSCRILDTPPEREFDDLVELASTICQTPVALISFVDQSRSWLKAKIGVDATELGHEIAFCPYTIRNDDLLVVEDTLLDERFAHNPLVIGPPHLRFYAGIPIRLDEWARVGTLCVADNVPRKLKSSQLLALRALARQAEAQLELHRRRVETAVRS